MINIGGEILSQLPTQHTTVYALSSAQCNVFDTHSTGMNLAYNLSDCCFLGMWIIGILSTSPNVYPTPISTFCIQNSRSIVTALNNPTRNTHRSRTKHPSGALISHLPDNTQMPIAWLIIIASSSMLIFYTFYGWQSEPDTSVAENKLPGDGS